MSESECQPKLTQTEAGNVLKSPTACYKFTKAINAIKMVYSDGVMTRSQARHANLTEIQNKNTIRPKDRGLLLLLLLLMLTKDQTGFANFTEIQDKNLTVHIESSALRCEYNISLAKLFKETVITEHLKNIMQLDDKISLEPVQIVKAKHSTVISKFTGIVQWIDTKKTFDNDWFGLSNGKLAGVHSITSEVPVEFRSKLFVLKKNVDGMTYRLFLQALANLVIKFSKLATTGNVTDFSAGHGAKQAFALPVPTDQATNPTPSVRLSTNTVK